MAKRLNLNQFISWDGTERHDQFEFLLPEATREAVENGINGDKIQKVLKGLYTLTLRGRLVPDADFVFVRELVEQFNADDDIAIIWRPLNAAKSDTNPELTFSICIAQAPPFAAERGQRVQRDVEFRIQTPITYSDGVGADIVIGA